VQGHWPLLAEVIDEFVELTLHPTH